MRVTRRIFDPLYGEITLQPDVARLTLTSEMQRLREVRLCNINSPSMLGAAGVSRFEHSVGTSHLAAICAGAWPGGLGQRSASSLQFAALLHDVGTSGFGHSVEYVLNADGFQHDDFSGVVGAGTRMGRPRPSMYPYRQHSLDPIYFGERPQIANLMEPLQQVEVSQLVRGETRLGPLISGSVDLDNIDNVYRLSYHIGLTRETTVPLELAAALFVNNEGQLTIRRNSEHLLEHWQKTRALLYDRLLSDVDDFAAKAMLESALVAARRSNPEAIRWNYVDFQLAESLQAVGGQSREIARRLMLGDLYCPIGIFESAEVDRIDHFLGDDKVMAVESLTDVLGQALAAGQGQRRPVSLSIHFVRDVKRTWRPIECVDEDGRLISLPRDSRRYLVGVFATSPEYGSHALASGRPAPPELYTNVVRSVISSQLDAALVDLESTPALSSAEDDPTLFNDSALAKHQTTA